MDSLDTDLLRLISKRDKYEKYHAAIRRSTVTKQAWQLIEDFGAYFQETPDASAIDSDFNMWLRVERHPGWKDDTARMYSQIVENILEVQESGDTSEADLIHRLDKVTKLTEFKAALREAEVGSITYEDFVGKVDSIKDDMVFHEEDTLYTSSLEDIASDDRGTGFFWRLEDLNKSVGPIRKGDFIVVAKRPETGGTSFLISEMSYMLEQMDEDSNIVLFNNEEDPTKVFTRMLSASIDAGYRDLLSDPTEYQKRYEEWLDKRSFDLVHDTSMSLQSIRRRLEGKKYDLIGINVLLKVGGTGEKEDHDKFQKLGEEMRKLAQEHGPVVAIVQADPSAEGIEYIPQDRIYKSKTALQGEADVLIMIGKSEDPHMMEKRYIHVAKNKIPPHDCVDLTKKHIKSEVEFDINTGRFSTVNFTDNSREKYEDDDSS